MHLLMNHQADNVDPSSYISSRSAKGKFQRMIVGYIIILFKRGYLCPKYYLEKVY